MPVVAVGCGSDGVLVGVLVWTLTSVLQDFCAAELPHWRFVRPGR